MFRLFCYSFIISLLTNEVNAQCFCYFGNPAGSDLSAGMLPANTLIFASYFDHIDFSKLYKGDKVISSDGFVAERAYLSHIGFVAGYGINQKLSIEADAGYYLNRSQIYKIAGTREKLSGYGLSSAVFSLKHLLFYDISREFEISWAMGARIPFSRDLQKVDGVTLPIEVQPSMGAYGLVFQAFIYKENFDRRTRYYFINRTNKFFENKQNRTFGTFYSNSLYFSKHFAWYQFRLSEWTFILQLNNQIKAKDISNDAIIHSSGNFLFFLVPQVNLSLNAQWNFSILASIPLYQHYNDIQLGQSYSFGISILRNFQFY